ncbi:hypothetical protein [Endozoicomonas lisbonensis]|uniref:Transposase zinc-ribbon domain-containing protein n=1 Tax=Endozoicomonas lisbonensis TaxID=3120522 RepID=A0ABV2SP43_9GAMM
MPKVRAGRCPTCKAVQSAKHNPSEMFLCSGCNEVLLVKPDCQLQIAPTKAAEAAGLMKKLCRSRVATRNAKVEASFGAWVHNVMSRRLHA